MAWFMSGSLSTKRDKGDLDMDNIDLNVVRPRNRKPVVPVLSCPSCQTVSLSKVSKDIQSWDCEGRCSILSVVVGVDVDVGC